MTERKPPPPEILQESASGPPVIFAHCLGFDGRQWNPQVSEFAARYQVLRVEWNYTRIGVIGGWSAYFRRQGARLSVGNGEIPEQRLVDPAGDLISLMDHAHIRNAHLVVSGTTFANAIIELALEIPARVRSLTVSAWTAGLRASPPNPEYADMVARQFKAYEELFAQGDIDRYVNFEVESGRYEIDHDLARQLAREMLAENISAQSPPLVATARPEIPILERLEDLRVPVLAVCGQDAPIMWRESSKYLASGVPDGREVSVSNARGYPNLDNPGRFNEQVLSFLAEVDAQQPI